MQTELQYKSVGAQALFTLITTWANVRRHVGMRKFGLMSDVSGHSTIQSLAYFRRNQCFLVVGMISYSWVTSGVIRERDKAKKGKKNRSIRKHDYVESWASQSGALKDCNNSVPSGERTLTELSPKSHTIRRPSKETVNKNRNLISLLLMHSANSANWLSRDVRQVQNPKQHGQLQSYLQKIFDLLKSLFSK